ncbi:hypothetical protein ACJX0J_024963, partial [Zea mays]
GMYPMQINSMRCGLMIIWYYNKHVYEVAAISAEAAIFLCMLNIQQIPHSFFTFDIQHDVNICQYESFPDMFLNLMLLKSSHLLHNKFLDFESRDGGDWLPDSWHGLSLHPLGT